MLNSLPICGWKSCSGQITKGKKIKCNFTERTLSAYAICRRSNIYMIKSHKTPLGVGRTPSGIEWHFKSQWVGIFALNTTWWRHQMEAFYVLLALCAGNSSVTGEFPSQRPVTRRFDVFFDLCMNKRLSKQSWGWWFEARSRSLWRHCNGSQISPSVISV